MARPSFARRRTLAVLVAGIACVAVVGGIVASAAVPAFPDNLVVFPDRDFVSVEGFEQHAGETALLEVVRGTTVMGSAKAVVESGGVAFEVNHPGGVCWGAGTNLQVTPDIRPGDVVSIKFLDGTAASEANPVAETTVSDAFVTADSSLDGATLTVVGHIGAGVNPAFLEQRIINPDLVDTPVAKRDIRALPGPLTPAARGGYSSGMEVDTVAHTFKATYVFDDPAVAQIAANADLGERAMAWQEEDADANRQGLTISEFGEPGGPGMGGCPGGPTQIGTPVPGSAFAVRSAEPSPASTDQLKVDWTPVQPAPGAPAVTGYSIEAIANTVNAAGERESTGKRVGPNATSATIKGLVAGETYTVEVRSSAAAGDGSVTLSAAFPLQVPASGDITAPALTATPAPGTLAAPTPTNSGVTLKATDPAAQNPTASDPNALIYYTTDGSAVIQDGGLRDDPAVHLYTGPIPVTDPVVPVEITAVAFDAADNHSDIVTGYYTQAPADPAPIAPTGLTATAGQASATFGWSVSPPDPTITGYGVQLYRNGAPEGALRETTARTTTITGLTVGDSYAFTVQAKNAVGYGPASALSATVVPTALTDRVTITSARWKANDFRVVGTGSAVGATITIRRGTPGCATAGALIGSGAVVAGGVYDLRFRNNAVVGTTQPATICAISNQGGLAGPFTTTR